MNNIPTAIDPMGSTEPLLPAGYRRVEWISSDPVDGAERNPNTTDYGGYPYIIASASMEGKEPDGDFTWQIDMMHRGYASTALSFGGMGVRRTTSGSQVFRFDISVTNAGIVFNMGDNKTSGAPGIYHVIPDGTLNKRHVIAMSYTGNRNNYSMVDGVIYDQNIDIISPDLYPTIGHYLRVGIRYNFGSALTACAPHYIRIYSTKTWRNGKLVSYLLPCVRELDGVAGLLNIITGTFTAPAQGAFAYPS